MYRDFIEELLEKQKKKSLRLSKTILKIPKTEKKKVD